MFFNDSWVIQIIIIYLLFLMSFSKNSYLLTMYLFLEIILLGLYISLIQGELFTGFL